MSLLFLFFLISYCVYNVWAIWDLERENDDLKDQIQTMLSARRPRDEAHEDAAQQDNENV